MAVSSSTTDDKQPKDVGFLDNVNWQNYTRFRPPYPPSLEKLIIDYQRAHSNSFRLAHDVGSGAGVFATRLAEYFSHVHVSDVKPEFVEQAKQRIDAFYVDNWWKAKFTFSVTPAEKADQAVAKGSVDLITLMQCAHWTVQEDMVRAAATSLGPNGTLAVVQVCPAPKVVGNEVVDKAVRALFELWGQNVLGGRGGKDALIGTRYLPQGNSGVESIPLLPEDVWIQDVTKRIDVNVKDGEEAPHAIPGLEHLIADSKADPQHRRYKYTSVDVEGEGWRYAVEASWFRALIGTMEDEGKLAVYEQRLQEVERLVEETSPNGTVEVEWVIAVLLATRK